MKAIVRQSIIYEIDGLTEKEIDAAADGHQLDPGLLFASSDDIRERMRESGHDAYEESCKVIGVKP